MMNLLWYILSFTFWIVFTIRFWMRGIANGRVVTEFTTNVLFFMKRNRAFLRAILYVFSKVCFSIRQRAYFTCKQNWYQKYKRIGCISEQNINGFIKRNFEVSRPVLR